MNRYPTDEELNAWIADIEKQQLYAPRNLKEQIMEKVRLEVTAEDIREGSRLSEVKKQDGQKKKEVAVSIRNKNTYQPVSFFAYSFKVAMGMAAAILMLILLPVQGGQLTAGEQIARREQKQTEAYKEWEENLQKERYVKEQREVLVAKGRNAAEEKFAEVTGFFNNFWKKEAEEN